MISVIIPIFNEAKYIKECIRSVLAQDYPQEQMEVLFVDGMSTDGTRAIVEQYAKQYPFIQLLDNTKRIVPTAMNIGIPAAKGDIIIRLDAHAIYPNNYFSVLVKQSDALQADNVGAVVRTLPAKDTPICQAIAIALSHPFGMGNSYFRIGVSQPTQVDTVPFGCYRKEVFKKIGFYDEELVRNQDDELNARLIQHGGKIYLLPEIVIDYFARDTIGKTARMFYQYGLYKPLVNKKLGAPATLRQFVPVGFVLGIIFGAILSIFVPYLWIAYVSVLALYVLIGAIIGTKNTTKTTSFLQICLLPCIFTAVHCSYGIGYLHGIWLLLTRQSFTAENNR